MVIVERGSQGVLRSRSLRTMFEDRKSVFVDLLKWEVPVLAGRFEIDQFDDEDATYVVIGDTAGDHRGSARLLKTTKPHILGDLFPQLCVGDVPRGPDVLEITRFCLSRRQNSASRRRTRKALVSALVAHALDSDIRTYTGVAEFGWYQQILAFGWNCRPLGLPVTFGRETLGALAIDITSETPNMLAANGMWQPPGDLITAIQEAA
jgi:N-acyl-L-homoserine lactone synthetase